MSQNRDRSERSRPTGAGSSLDIFERMMRSAPQTGAEGSHVGAQPPRSERQRKADATTEAARQLIEEENEAREAKTRRLRASRLAQGDS